MYLFSKLNLRNLNLKNRIVLSPMCQYKAIEGHVQDWHFLHHSRFALGGMALAFIEATGVMPEGRITHGCTGIWDDAHIDGLSRIVKLYKSQNVAVGIQLAHAGRRASCERLEDGGQPIPKNRNFEARWDTIAPSSIEEKEGFPIPKSMTHEEILKVIDAFKLATKRSLEAGFDVVEIHGAHGYLIHSFFSPISNKRNDDFGGDLRRRMNFPIMVTEAVREIWPEEKPLFFRLSCVDHIKGGISIEDSVELVKELKLHGVDVVDCSSGGMSDLSNPTKQSFYPGFQVPYSEKIKNDAEIKSMAVGLITEGQQAENIIKNNQADLVALGREMMSDANWAYRAALNLGVKDPYEFLPSSYRYYLKIREEFLK